MGPPTATPKTRPAERGASALYRGKRVQLTMSLSFFKASAFTVLDAGFALNVQGSLVKGFTPLRAGLAGVFFTCVATRPMYASMAPFTSRALTPVVSDTVRYAADAVMALGPAAFIAFGAFIAFIAFMALGGNMMTANCGSAE